MISSLTKDGVADKPLEKVSVRSTLIERENEISVKFIFIIVVSVVVIVVVEDIFWVSIGVVAVVKYTEIDFCIVIDSFCDVFWISITWVKVGEERSWFDDCLTVSVYIMLFDGGETSITCWVCWVDKEVPISTCSVGNCFWENGRDKVVCVFSFEKPTLMLDDCWMVCGGYWDGTKEEGVGEEGEEGWPDDEDWDCKGYWELEEDEGKTEGEKLIEKDEKWGDWEGYKGEEGEVEGVG